MRDWVDYVTVLILVLTALAVWLAPIQAVKTGKILSDIHDKREQKMKLFLNLFALRGTPVNYAFVHALNQIEIVFQDSPLVLESWRAFLTQLRNEGTEAQLLFWEECKVELLSKMAQDLGYNQLGKDILRNSYFPKGLGAVESENHELRSLQIDYYKESLVYFALNGQYLSSLTKFYEDQTQSQNLDSAEELES